MRYESVYPGTGVVYYGNQHELEYDFIVHPGADATLDWVDWFNMRRRLGRSGTSRQQNSKRSTMRRPPWPDPTNPVAEAPGTIQSVESQGKLGAQ